MKILKTFVLALTLLLCKEAVAARTKDKELKLLRQALVEETATYIRYHEHERRNKDLFRPYLYSAMRVAKMFPSYPAANDQDRMLMFYSFGNKESGFHRNKAVANIPGARYANGTIKIKKFSVDYGWTGINNFNVQWVYEVATCIQQKKPFPKYLNLTGACRDQFRCCYIPSDLTLKHIDLITYWQARKHWQQGLVTGKNPNLIRRELATGIPFHELTQDEIDSMLIYRVIIELDRMCRGWSYETYDTRLYSFLSQFIDK